MESELLKGPPEKPAYVCDTAIASLLAMMGHTWSIMVSLLTSCESVKGEDTMIQAPKCERVSAIVKPTSEAPPGPCLQPTSSMSGYAQHPG